MRFLLIFVLFSAQIFAQVELYEHTDCKGQRWLLNGEGYFQSDRGDFRDDCVSSVTVSDGYKANFYEHPKDWARGAKVELQAGTHNLGNFGLNDVLTGVEVICVKKIDASEIPKWRKKIMEEVDGFASGMKSRCKAGRVLVFKTESNNLSTCVAIRLSHAGLVPVLISNPADAKSLVFLCRKTCIRAAVICTNAGLTGYRTDLYFERIDETYTRKLPAIPGPLTDDFISFESPRAKYIAQKYGKQKWLPGGDLLQDIRARFGLCLVEVEKESVVIGDWIEANDFAGLVVDEKDGYLCVVVQVGDALQKKNVLRSVIRKVSRL